MLVAMTLVIIFGSIAIRTLQYGSSLWRIGHRRAAAYDAATIVFHQIADDIGACRSQFWNKEAEDYDMRIKFWVDGDDEGRQRLRFVRGLPDQTLNPYLRAAGDVANATGVYNLIDMEDDLAPLEGLCEVAYLRGLDGDDSDTLYRAVLSPIGDDPVNLDDPGHTFFDRDVLATADRIKGKALPLAENVLHFEVRCWSQYTTTWEGRGDPDFHVWTNSYKPTTCGPLFAWDSDRLDDASTPSFRMDWGQPGFADPDDYATEEERVDDNVFPSAIMVVVVTTPPDRLPGVGRLEVVEDLGDSIRVRGNVPAYNTRWPYIRIEDEWIRFEAFDEDTQTFTGCERAVRGTAEVAHAVGAPVEFGFTFSRVFRNLTGRESW